MLNEMPVEKLILLIMCLNIVLSAFHKILEIIKDKTATPVDNKMFDAIQPAASFLKTALEWLSASRKK